MYVLIYLLKLHDKTEKNDIHYEDFRSANKKLKYNNYK